MAKYTNTAGFKSVSEEDVKETSGKLPRPVFFLIIVGVLAFIAVAFLIVHAVTSNQGEAATEDETESITVTTEDYDYNVLFGLEETTVPSEPATINPQSMTIAIPQPITQPVTTMPQKSEASSRTESHASESESSTPQQNHSDSTPHSQPSQQSSASESHRVSQQEIGDSGSLAVYVSDISLSHTSISLTVGQTFTLSATIFPSNATNKSVTWTSSNGSVAAVSRGVVKAQKAGTATVYVVSSNGRKASCAVTVAEKQESRQTISLSPGDTTIKRGQELTIRLIGSNRCTWSESNPFVIKDINRGNDYYTVKAIKKGITNIIATLSNGQSCKIKITVE